MSTTTNLTKYPQIELSNRQMVAIETEITDIDQDIKDFKSGKITLEDLKALTSARRNQVRQRGNIIADTTNRIRAVKLMHTINGRVDVPASKSKKLVGK